MSRMLAHLAPIAIGLLLFIVHSGAASPTESRATSPDSMSLAFYDRIRELLDQNGAHPDSSGVIQRPNFSPSANDEDNSLSQSVDTLHGQKELPAPVSGSNHDATPPPKPHLLADWPQVELRIGQITAVGVTADGDPVLFHRGERVWDANSFTSDDVFTQPDEPILMPTVLKLDAASGRTLQAVGRRRFFMPHGLTVDHHDHFWLTDVALHQVLKFQRLDDIDAERPSIQLGVAFTPGSGPDYLCKPTAVAVATTGEFFVADGYCNARILKYNAAGHLLRVIPQLPDEFMSLNVPHGLALVEPLDLLCVADRENSQVVCPRAGLRSSHGEGQPSATIQEPDLGRVFAVATCGTFVFAVNGPTAPHIPVRGFTIDPRSEQIVDHWGTFRNPHSLAFDANRTAMYVTETGPNRVWKFRLD